MCKNLFDPDDKYDLDQKALRNLSCETVKKPILFEPTKGGEFIGFQCNNSNFSFMITDLNFCFFCFKPKEEVSMFSYRSDRFLSRRRALGPGLNLAY